jgi:hypothetical protein
VTSQQIDQAIRVLEIKLRDELLYRLHNQLESNKGQIPVAAFIEVLCQEDQARRQESDRLESHSRRTFSQANLGRKGIAMLKNQHGSKDGVDARVALVNPSACRPACSLPATRALPYN